MRGARLGVPGPCDPRLDARVLRRDDRCGDRARSPRISVAGSAMRVRRFSACARYRREDDSAFRSRIRAIGLIVTWAPSGSRRRAGSPRRSASGCATISRTSDANSSGRPSRGGNGTILPSASCTSGVRLAIIGVSKMPGAIVITRMPERASSRAIGSVMPTTPPSTPRTPPGRSGRRTRRPTRC